MRISDWSSDVCSSDLIELSYKPVDDVMAYAKYSRGYRKGSVNLASEIGTDTFDPEHVKAYEIGAKTSFGGPVPGRFNVAETYNEHTNQQMPVETRRESLREGVCQYALYAGVALGI